MIRITLEKQGYESWHGKRIEPRVQVKEFPDDQRAEAAEWFIHDSYFDESYTVRALWEIIPDDLYERQLAYYKMNVAALCITKEQAQKVINDILTGVSQ